MDNLNETIETLRTQFRLLESNPTRANRTDVRKSLQLLKAKCHSLRKEVLGKSKPPVEPVAQVEPVAPVEPVEPVAPVEPPKTPVVEEVIPEPVESHPIPESKPKLTKKRKKVKKV